MLVYDFLERAVPLAREWRWDELEDIGVQLAARHLSESRISQLIGIPLDDYGAALEEMLASAATRAAELPKVKALYWEFDVDNGWYSSIALCSSYDPVDPEWGADEVEWSIGPDLPGFGELYRDAGDSGSVGDACFALLAARTFAAFGRAYQRAGRQVLPVGAAFHGSEAVLLMPRTGVDLEKEERKALARRMRIPRGEWVWGQTPKTLWPGAGVAIWLEGDREAFDGFSKPWSRRGWVEGWTEPRLRLNRSGFSDLQQAAVYYPLCSERLRSVIEREKGPGDAIQWLSASVLSADGRERRPYWFPNFFDPPTVADREKSMSRGGWISLLVVDPELIPSDRSFVGLVPESYGDFTIPRDAMLMRRRTAAGLRKAGCTGIEFRRVRTERPNLPAHVRTGSENP
jgi:hypothetical protein